MSIRIGLIAGKGNLPVIWTKAANKKGIEVYAYKLVESADQSLKESADQVRNINIGQLDELIKMLKEDQIKEVVMIGKVEKTLLFQGLTLDNRMKNLLEHLENLNDDTIMLAIIKELSNEGIKVKKQFTHLDELLPMEGVLTTCQPDEQLLLDIKYGFKMAREIGRLDIGQTVVVKNKAVLAVEAIEGTDKAILRGGQLGGHDIVVAKVSKPQQDFRFDIPTVGETTLENLIEVKAKALVIEASRTFLVDKDSFIKKAEDNNIVVIAMNLSDI